MLLQKKDDGNNRNKNRVILQCRACSNSPQCTRVVCTACVHFYHKHCYSGTYEVINVVKYCCKTYYAHCTAFLKLGCWFLFLACNAYVYFDWMYSVVSSHLINFSLQNQEPSLGHSWKTVAEPRTPYESSVRFCCSASRLKANQCASYAAGMEGGSGGHAVWVQVDATAGAGVVGEDMKLTGNWEEEEDEEGGVRRGSLGSTEVRAPPGLESTLTLCVIHKHQTVKTAAVKSRHLGYSNDKKACKILEGTGEES